jgi:uncharacterized membrane protein YcaP (DUF421 family)
MTIIWMVLVTAAKMMKQQRRRRTWRRSWPSVLLEAGDLLLKRLRRGSISSLHLHLHLQEIISIYERLHED